MIRQTRFKILAGLACVAIAGLGAFTVDAGGKKSDSEVKVTITGDKPDASGKQRVVVSMVHNKGWHSYANPVGNEDFTTAQTVVNVSAKVKPAAVKVSYPAGKVHTDKVVGDYKVYENKIEIPVMVQRAEGDTSPLDVSVRFMACHDKGVCLLPATVKATVP